MFYLGFDPGRDKCGMAVVENNRCLHYHEVILSDDVTEKLASLCQQFPIEQLIMGNQTTAKQWKIKLEKILPRPIPITMVDERNSSVEARDRYWQMYPPQGLTRLIPQGLRVPPRPIDDIVAILLIERYLAQI
ncbi:MAG: resolvase [Snowella sp.]|jgi:RNase H-fold protein (predicted Holliday junction resolvase)|nr:MAG: resolvase [Snowella sp.]